MSPGNATGGQHSLETEDVSEPLTYPGERYVIVGMLSFLSLVGTCGNALVLYVYSQKKDKLVSTLFILVLAVVDFSTCLVVMPFTSYMEYNDFNISLDPVCKLYQFLITSNIPFSALIMVAIAIDRYLCICHPFLRILNLERAKVIAGIMAVFAASLGVIVSLMYAVRPTIEQEEFDQTFNYTVNCSHSDAGCDVSTLGNATPAGFINISHLNFTYSCQPNFDILSYTFLQYYLKFFTSQYLVCLVVVIVLYVLIYRSVLARRTKRQKAKSKSLPLVQLTNETDGATENTLLTPDMNGDQRGTDTRVKETSNGATLVVEKKSPKDQHQKDIRKSTKRDKNRMANLKTAAMLFVVTLVFIVTFMPACLMGTGYITYSKTIFYMYFANNVANPVIYSFMNKNFRDDLRKLFCRR